jgi:hypothetical protein
MDDGGREREARVGPIKDVSACLAASLAAPCCLPACIISMGKLFLRIYLRFFYADFAIYYLIDIFQSYQKDRKIAIRGAYTLLEEINFVCITAE